MVDIYYHSRTVSPVIICVIGIISCSCSLCVRAFVSVRAIEIVWLAFIITVELFRHYACDWNHKIAHTAFVCVCVCVCVCASRACMYARVSEIEIRI